MKYFVFFTLSILMASAPILASSENKEEGTIHVHSVLGFTNNRFPVEISERLAPALLTYASECSESERDQFAAPLSWYRPTPEELTFLSSLNFQPEHLGAALRFRKFITPENAGLFQRVLGDATWQESQSLLPAALGLSPVALEEATLLPAYTDRLAFLQNAPREDAWVYGMLGSDLEIDEVLEVHIRARIEASPEYVSALFIRNLKEGSDLTRMRLTGFLLQVVDALKNQQRFQKLGYQADSNVVRVLEKRKCIPPFGCFLVHFDASNEPGLRLLKPGKGAPMPAWTYTPSPFLEPRM